MNPLFTRLHSWCWLCVLFLSFGFLATSQLSAQDAPPPPPPPPPPVPDEAAFISPQEVMPYFLAEGCDELTSKQERKACRNKKMLEYIYSQVRYPEAAKKAGIEGMTVVTFAIEKDGTMSGMKLLRDIGGGCGEEALRVMKELAKQGVVWQPGTQRGQKVKVQYNIPIKFKLGPETCIEGPKTAVPMMMKDAVAVEMPRITGCEHLETLDEKTKCSNQKVIEYVYSNLKYPKLARKTGTEGTVVINFVVEKTGQIRDAKIVRNIGAECGAEALRVVNSMNAAGIKWVPGKSEGKLVDVEFNLPVKFKLTKDAPTTSDKADSAPRACDFAKPQPPKTFEGDPVYKVVEEMPRFPGCEQIEDAAERTQCSQKELLMFVYNNLKYPAEARKNDIQGTVVVNFFVDKEGIVREPKIVRNIGAGCDEAVLEVVAQMPKWIPGKQAGKVVNVSFNLPVRFKLESDAPKASTPPIKVRPDAPSLPTATLTPNPTSDLVRIQWTGEAAPLELQLISSTGQVVRQQSFKDFDGQLDYEMKIDQLAGGTYFVVLQQGKAVSKQALVVQRAK